MKSRICTLAVAVVVAGSFATVAHAQDENVELEEDTEEADTAAEGEEEKAADEEKKTDEKGESKEEDAAADAGSADTSPVEEKGKTYRFVGVRYRGIVVPAFMIHLFADGGRTIYVHAFGPEFGIRKDNFEYNLSAWLGFYSFDWMSFKGKDDDVREWELVDSGLDSLFLSSDFLWSHPFNEQLALNYGIGAGLGIVFGTLKRRQSYPGAGDDPNDPNTWSRCQSFGVPDTTYCTSDNDHFDSNNYEEPSWFSGGSKPVLFPWLALQTGFRYKPHRRFVGRLDVGFGTSGFFFGLGADYGL